MHASVNPQADQRTALWVKDALQVDGPLAGGALRVITPGSTPAIDASLGNVFTLTPAEAETLSVTGGLVGQRLAIIVTTSGSSSFTLTFGTGFKTTGTLATGTTTAKVFVVNFISDGTNFIEVSRTTAM